jgi:hypothetical protein
MINLDETGFGASKSGRSKSARVVVPISFQGKQFREEVSESHFVSVLAAVTLAGDVLKPGFITKRSTDHSDTSMTSYFQYVSRYSSEKAFVTRAIFSDYLRTVVLPFIETVRSELGNPRSPPILIFDGHKSHMLEVIRAFTAEHGITLFLLPPHSGHLLQPLDQGFFCRVKVQFRQFQRIKEPLKATSTCEHFFTGLQGSFITRLIWNSWSPARIVPVIDSGNCIRTELDCDRIPCDPTVQKQQPIQENARGRRVCQPQFGVLATKQCELQRAGCRPFCQRPLEVSEEDGQAAKEEEAIDSDEKNS